MSVDSVLLIFFFKQKTAYEMRISDWSSNVCSSDLLHRIKQPKRTTKRYLCTSRLISYADRKAGGPSYFCRRTEYPSVERPGTVPAVVLCGSAVACSCRPSLFLVSGRTGPGRGGHGPPAYFPDRQAAGGGKSGS